MPSSLHGERVLTELDHARLCKLHGVPAYNLLGEVLAGADLVPSREVAADVVTMYSQVVVRDSVSRRIQRYTLCYPADAEPESGFISVLSPLGLALIGRRLGESVDCFTPTGGWRTHEIVELVFQPEASGDYVT